MAQQMTKAEVFEVVKNIIIEILDIPTSEIAIEKNLSDLGANSVDRMEIVTMSMECLGLKIPLLSFAAVSNIEGLVDVLYANVQK